MYTTYHFQSAAEINADILDAIKIAFKGKPVVITVEEETKENAQEIPEWQKEVVRNRQQYFIDNPQELLNWEDEKKSINFD